jgi:hypothetical protein
MPVPTKSAPVIFTSHPEERRISRSIPSAHKPEILRSSGWLVNVARPVGATVLTNRHVLFTLADVDNSIHIVYVH